MRNHPLMPAIRVSVAVTSDNPETITRAIEAFSRAAAGLALEASAEVYLIVGPDLDVEEEAP
jgi:hypothetical protein